MSFLLPYFHNNQWSFCGCYIAYCFKCGLSLYLVQHWSTIQMKDIAAAGKRWEALVFWNLNPKVTVFMSFFWAWSRWVSKETNELRLFLLVEHFGFEGLQCLSLSELWFWSLAWTCLKLNLLGLLIIEVTINWVVVL